MPVGMPFTAGFRALFEGASFELQQVFRERPAATSPSRSAARHSRGRGRSRCDGGNPLRDRTAPLRRLHRRHEPIPQLLDAERAIEALDACRSKSGARHQRGAWRGIVTTNSVPGLW